MYFSAGPSITALASAKGKREKIEHKIDKKKRRHKNSADSTKFLLIGRNARYLKMKGQSNLHFFVKKSEIDFLNPI